MITTTQAPDFPGGRPGQTSGYPSKGAKVGPAWAEIWRLLQTAQEALDGRELAAHVAPMHDLQPATLVALISRAAKAGILSREPRVVTTRRGPRTRTFYRISR